MKSRKKNKASTEAEILNTEYITTDLSLLELENDLSPEDQLRKLGIYYIPTDIIRESLLPIQQDMLLKHITQFPNKLTLIVNSEGGSIDATWGLINIIDFISQDVETVGIGTVCSAAVGILAAGTRGLRRATKETLLMTHRLSWGFDGSEPQLMAATDGLKLAHAREVAFWLKHSNLSTKEEVENLILKQTDKWMTATEAKELGIIDIIV